MFEEVLEYPMENIELQSCTSNMLKPNTVRHCIAQIQNVIHKKNTQNTVFKKQQLMKTIAQNK